MALVNPNIAMSYRAPEMPNQLANYAAMQQIQSGQRQAEVAQMQLDKMRREENALDQMMAGITAKGGPSDPMVAADLMIKSKIPHFMDTGFKLQAAARQRAEDIAAMGLPSAGGAAPVNAMAPASEPYPGYNESIGMAPVNAMAPAAAAPAAPVNAMAAPTAPVNAMAPSADMEAQIAAAKRKMLSPTVGVRDVGKLELEQLTSEAPDAKLMKRLGYPLTQAGYQAFRDAQRQDRFLTPAEEAQQLRLRAASRPPGVSITNVGEKAEAGEFGKLLVGQYSDISKAANLAVKTLPAIESNLSALNKGLDTGFGTEAKAAGAKILGALGVKDAEKYATDTQTFQSNAIQAVLQKQLEQKGPQTESDAQRIEQIGSQLGKTKAANEFILSVAKEQLRRDMSQRDFYTNWRKQTGSFNGAEDAWFAADGSKSLFDRPGLKKFAVSGEAALQPAPTGARPSLDKIFGPRK